MSPGAESEVAKRYQVLTEQALQALDARWRDRFQAEEVWERLGLPVDECARHMSESNFMRNYRTDLFTRIVPMMKDIGLWGPKIRKAYEQMGIIGYCDTDVEQLSANDQEVAERFERDLRERMQDIESVAGASAD